MGGGGPGGVRTGATTRWRTRPRRLLVRLFACRRRDFFQRFGGEILIRVVHVVIDLGAVEFGGRTWSRAVHGEVGGDGVAAVADDARGVDAADGFSGAGG